MYRVVYSSVDRTLLIVILALIVQPPRVDDESIQYNSFIRKCDTRARSYPMCYMWNVSNILVTVMDHRQYSM